MHNDDTIAAVATGAGGAIAVIRISGSDALRACDAIFRAAAGDGALKRVAAGAAVEATQCTDGAGCDTDSSAADTTVGRTCRTDSARGHVIATSEGGRFHYGSIVDGAGRIVDDIVASVWRTPRSYTGEDVVEISCHGSRYVQQQIMQLLAAQGVRPAEAGEFTLRAMVNGKLDLAQAEAVADLIASEDRAAHAVATNQMRGGYSAELQEFRSELVTLASLLELELDFGEEDVEFADRARLIEIIGWLTGRIERLADSFAVGNALKNGVAVAIAGSPNVGKSTLLNALVGDERALVSEIAGTTRDTVEERVNIGGVAFRFIDTAGIRATDDRLERMGIDRARASVERADVVLLVVEAGADAAHTDSNIAVARTSVTVSDRQRLCVIVNKIDTLSDCLGTAPSDIFSKNTPVCNAVRKSETETNGKHAGATIGPRSAAISGSDIIAISARRGDGLDELHAWLVAGIDAESVYNGNAVVSNTRHHVALCSSLAALRRAGDALRTSTPPDLLCQDIREALHHLGTITGEITTDEILGEIFSKFCIGK